MADAPIAAKAPDRPGQSVSPRHGQAVPSVDIVTGPMPLHGPATLTDVLELQRSAGNRAVAHWLPVQRQARGGAETRPPRGPEREWSEVKPAGVRRLGPRAILLWNYVVGDHDPRPAHERAILRFLRDGALIHEGAVIEVLGYASQTGWERSAEGFVEENGALADRRAAEAASAIRRELARRRLRTRVEIVGPGGFGPHAHADEQVMHALNRSVEVRLVSPQGSVPGNREEMWRYAKAYLEAQVGAVVAGDPSLIWTPTAAGIVRIMPAHPGDLAGNRPEYGIAVPRGPCGRRPARSCMPEPLRLTTVVLGDMLDRVHSPGVRELNPATVRRTVDAFTGRAEAARDRREDRHSAIQAAQAAFEVPVVEEELVRFLRFERDDLEGDDTCIYGLVG